MWVSKEIKELTMKAKFYALIIMSIINIFLVQDSGAGEFRWCKSVAEVPFSELVTSKVPKRPANFKTASHMIKDGEWEFDLPLSKVWKLYTKTPMKKIWASHYIVHQFSLAPGSNIPEKEESSTPGIQLGTRMFFDIKAFLTGKMCNMAIGFQVTRFIPESLIQFDYLDFSPPYGTQWMYFEKLSKSRTRVTQFSQYLGKNLIIDSFYKLFHNEEIPLLHQGLQQLAIESSYSE